MWIEARASWLKAVKLIHKSRYLDDHLLFSKNYEELLYVGGKSEQIQSVLKLKIKADTNFENLPNEEEIELIAHILDITPGYIDMNFNDGEKKIFSIDFIHPLNCY